MISLHDQFAAGGGNLHTLVAERLAQLLKTLAGINKLYFADTLLGLAFGNDPDIGGNTGVIEQVVRQLDNGLQPVVLQQIATDLTLAASGIPLKQRRTVLDDGHTAVFLQLGHSIEHEQHLSVALRRQSRRKASGLTQLVLCLDMLLGCLPVDAKGRIGYDIVELVTLELVIAQRIAQTHIVGIAALDQHIGLGDAIGLRIELLTVAGDLRLGINLAEPLIQTGQHLAGAHRHVVDGGHDALVPHLLLMVAHEQFAH